jgi:hypothetical protein
MLVLAGGSRRAWRAPGRVLAGWRAGCDSRLRAGSEIGVWHGLGRLRFQSPELHLSNGCRGVRGAREKRSASGPGPPGFGMDDDRTKPNNSHTDAASALGDMLPSCPRGRMLGGVLAVLRLHLVATALAVCGGVGWMAGGRLNWLAGDGGRLVWWFESGLETVASIASWDPKMDLSGGVSTAPEGGATAWSAGMHSSPAAQQAARQGDRGADQPPKPRICLGNCPVWLHGWGWRYRKSEPKTETKSSASFRTEQQPKSGPHCIPSWHFIAFPSKSPRPGSRDGAWQFGDLERIAFDVRLGVGSCDTPESSRTPSPPSCQTGLSAPKILYFLGTSIAAPTLSHVHVAKSNEPHAKKKRKRGKKNTRQNQREVVSGQECTSRRRRYQKCPLKVLVVAVENAMPPSWSRRGRVQKPGPPPPHAHGPFQVLRVLQMPAAHGLPSGLRPSHNFVCSGEAAAMHRQ